MAGAVEELVRKRGELTERRRTLEQEIKQIDSDQLGSRGSGNLNEQSERRRRWLLRLWAECPLGVPLCAVRLRLSELTCILPITGFLVLRACQ